MSSQEDLLYRLLQDMPQDEKQHIIDVVEKNHAHQLDRKRNPRRRSDDDSVED